MELMEGGPDKKGNSESEDSSQSPLKKKPGRKKPSVSIPPKASASCQTPPEMKPTSGSSGNHNSAQLTPRPSANHQSARNVSPNPTSTPTRTRTPTPTSTSTPTASPRSPRRNFLPPPLHSSGSSPGIVVNGGTTTSNGISALAESTTDTVDNNGVQPSAATTTSVITSGPSSTVTPPVSPQRQVLPTSASSPLAPHSPIAVVPSADIVAEALGQAEASSTSSDQLTPTVSVSDDHQHRTISPTKQNGHVNDHEQLNHNGGLNLEEIIISSHQHDWRDGIPDGERYRRFLKFEKYDNFLDADFQVGPNKEVIRAHRLMLAANCSYFERCFGKEGSVGEKDMILFETLDPAGFRLMLEFVYTKKLNLGEWAFDQLQAVRLLLTGIDCARHISYAEFEKVGLSCIHQLINRQNALPLFVIFKEMKYPELEQFSLEFINSGIRDIFQTGEFVNLSTDGLALFLSSDEWYLPELEVFEATKKWALQRILYGENGLGPDAKEITSKLLRDTLGDAFHQIRFLNLNPEEFTMVCKTHPGLFNPMEMGHIMEYVISPQITVPILPFVARARKMPAIMPAATTITTTAAAIAAASVDPGMMSPHSSASSVHGSGSEDSPESPPITSPIGTPPPSAMTPVSSPVATPVAPPMSPLSPPNKSGGRGSQTRSQDASPKSKKRMERALATGAAVSEVAEPESPSPRSVKRKLRFQEKNVDVEAEAKNPEAHAHMNAKDEPEAEVEVDVDVDTDPAESDQVDKEPERRKRKYKRRSTSHLQPLTKKKKKSSGHPDAEAKGQQEAAPKRGGRKKELAITVGIVEPDEKSPSEATSKKTFNLPLRTRRSKGSLSGSAATERKKPPFADFVQNLAKVSNVDETVSVIGHFTLSLPTIRIHLPHLNEFRLIFDPMEVKKDGESLRNAIKSNFSKLSSILFFDLLPRGATKKLPNLMRQIFAKRINLSIIYYGANILKIDPAAGALTMTMLSDAQELLTICGQSDKFVLKHLSVHDCQLSALECVSWDNLETVVLNGVEGIRNWKPFLRGCTKVTKFVCDCLGLHKLDLYSDILAQKENLTKVYLGKAQLYSRMAYPNIPPFKNLKELYLDMVTVPTEMLQHFPRIFPAVNRVLQFEVNECDPMALYHILQMPSLEFVHAWDISGETNESQPEIRRLRSFLSRVFDPEFGQNATLPFILRTKTPNTTKKKRNLPGTSKNVGVVDPFDPLNWSGSKIVNRNDTDEEIEKVYKLDFRHGSYYQFFDSFQTFYLFETAEDEVDAAAAALGCEEENNRPSSSTATCNKGSKGQQE